MENYPTTQPIAVVDRQRPYTPKSWWLLVQIALDSVAWIIGLVIAFMLRYSLLLNQNSVFDVIDLQSVALSMGFAIILQILVGYGMKVYRGLYSYGSFEEVWRAGATVGIVSVALFLFSYVDEALGLVHVPHGVPPISVGITLLFMAAMRMVKRIYVEHKTLRNLDGEPVIVYGAGFTGRTVIEALMHDDSAYMRPVAVVDDNPQLRGINIHNVPVYNTGKELDAVIRRYAPKKMIVAITNMPHDRFDRVWARMQKHGVEVTRVASASEKLFGNNVVETDDNELMKLIRGEINYDVDTEVLRSYLQGKRVLVTGAGGSIGSELCRQIHEYDPELLMMLDRDETLLMETKLSITGESSLDDERIILADIREGENLRNIFLERKPQVVVHAAALKHVSALEAYPEEAWKTNSLGTLNVLYAAQAADVETFVNVSTDKAADPKTALGQSKRTAECLTSWFGQQTGKTYVSVRFGNVFGSRGSIKPLFTQQILNGGPITLTDENATRYFMLITDACLLVMLAGAIGHPGEVMVLDMGEPVFIYDVAHEMRKAYERYDVDIVVTGLRPGEKLDETLFGANEQHTRSTQNKFISHSTAPALNPEDLDYDQWIQNYEAHRSYERHGFTRVVDPRQGRLLEEHRD